MEMRSPLGRVRGLGSAKTGVQHWLAQRITAVALVPLSLWFVYSVVALNGASHATFTSWQSEFGNVVLMISFIVALFYHAQLGLQVVVEDYAHGEAAKTTCIMVIKFAIFLSGLSCIIATLRIAFTG